MDLDPPRSWASQLHLTLWQGRVSSPEWTMDKNGEWKTRRVRAKTFQVTMSCRWKCVRGSYSRFHKISASMVSLYVSLYVSMYVTYFRHCPSGWMDPLTCSCVPACLTLYRWDQLRCMIRRRAAFRLHDFGRNTSPVGASEVQQTALEAAVSNTMEILKHRSAIADLPTWLIWSDHFCLSTTCDVGTGAVWAPWYKDDAHGTHLFFIVLPGNEKHRFAGDIDAFAHCQQALLIARPWEKFHPHFTSDCEQIPEGSTRINLGSTRILYSFKRFYLQELSQHGNDIWPQRLHALTDFSPENRQHWGPCTCSCSCIAYAHINALLYLESSTVDQRSESFELFPETAHMAVDLNSFFCKQPFFNIEYFLQSFANPTFIIRGVLMWK